MKRLLSPLVLSCLALSAIAPLAAAQSTASKTAAPATKQRAPQATSPYAQRADAQQWAQDFAQRQGIDLAWLQHAMGQAQLLPQVQRLMTPSPSVRTTARDWQDYRRRFIDPVRIRAGVNFWNTHADTLARAQATYGVPAAMIVGIIGVETIYGQQMGKLRVLDTLSTLAFDFPAAHPRAAERQRYFRGELEQFLGMMHQSGQDPTRQRGSYAGAVGLGQFMPTSWANWAVDFDGDGQVDLFNSPADAIGSVAHYFQAHGWVAGAPVWFAPEFDTAQLDLPQLLAPDIKPSFTASQMQQLGVTPQQGMEHSGLLALVELRNGERAPSYIVGTQNFYTITRYNWSSYYAMAVHDLGQEVAAAREARSPDIARPVTLPEGWVPNSEAAPALSPTATPTPAPTVQPPALQAQ